MELKVKTTNKYNSDSPVSFLFINLQQYKLYMYMINYINYLDYTFSFKDTKYISITFLVFFLIVTIWIEMKKQSGISFSKYNYAFNIQSDS